MIPPGFRPQQNHDAAELEALQADVMRFVAIIGLCLAAIFALVQQLEQESQAAAQAATMAQTDPGAPGDIRLQAPVAVAPDPGRGATPNPPQPQPVPDTATGEPPVTSLAGPPIPVYESPPELPPEPSPESPPKSPPESPPKSPPESPPESPPTSPPESPPPPPPARPQQGFSLSFVSPEALMTLLQSGEVRLYTGAGGRFWRYDPGRRSFIADTAPGQYYRMESSTVPRQLHDWMQAAGRQPMEWGVVLAPATRAQLSDIMDGRSGGDMRIGADGEVHLIPAQPDGPGQGWR